MEDALRELKTEDTSKAARDSKIGKEFLICISSKSIDLKKPLAGTDPIFLSKS